MNKQKTKDIKKEATFDKASSVLFEADLTMLMPK